MPKPISRAGGPQNRALRDEDQPISQPEQDARDAFEKDVRLSAKSGLSYAQVAEKHKLDINDVLAIIQPDLVQRVDSETQELIAE